MGGSAIKSIIGKEADRINLEERNKYISLFENHSNIFVPIREIKCKTDFGDIDFLTPSFYFKDVRCSVFEKILKSSGIDINGKVTNSDIISYAVNDCHQLDLLFVDDIDLAFEYYSDNDRGMILGNIFHHLGFSYGHKGLYLKLEDSKFLLSQDTRRILEFIGYNSNSIEMIINRNGGFNTYEDMFDWILLCPYFNSKYFFWESLNNENRTRNKKRKTWNSFVSYIDKLPVGTEPNLELLKREALHFFNKDLEYMGFKRRVELDRTKKRLFDGNKISNLTGLKQKELGEFIVKFKEYIDYRLKALKQRESLKYQYFLSIIDKEIIEFYEKTKESDN
jgi:hypothetical protein